jgi:hypothetical protein
MKQMSSPDPFAIQNHLHFCGTVEVQAFQLLVPRDFLHRRQEAFSIEMMKKTLNAFLQDELLGTW